MRNIHRLVALTLAGGVAACMPGARRQTTSATGPAAIIFTNQSLQQANVYAVPRSGARVRIGTVPAGRTDTLTVDGAAIPPGGAVAIVADLLAVGTSPWTGPLTLFPGDRITVTLPPSANMLTVLPAPK